MTTAPLLVTGDTPIQAWMGVLNALLSEGNRFNIVVHVVDPMKYDDAELMRFNPKNIRQASDSIFDVANTIFPAASRSGGSVHTFYEYYKRVYRRGNRRHRGTWGTYFQRLVAFGDDEENQLEKVIRPLNDWKNKPKAALVVHLSATHLDTPRPLGAPCWQYGQFITSPPDKLSLVVTYRSHDYFNKALGNFVGLSRLLAYVCQRTGLSPGTLTCLSTYAFIDGSKKDAKTLLEQ